MYNTSLIARDIARCEGLIVEARSYLLRNDRNSVAERLQEISEIMKDRHDSITRYIEEETNPRFKCYIAESPTKKGNRCLDQCETCLILSLLSQ